MSKNNINRLPRPLGITGLMVEYHKQEHQAKHELYLKIRDSLINQWVITNGTICGKPYNLNQLADHLGCDTSAIQDFMKARLLSTKIWDKDVQEEMLNALIGQQVMWTMEDRMDIQSQVDILKGSQGPEYKPFISGELNKALKLKLESTSSVQSIIRAFTGGVNNTLIFNQQNNNNTEVSGCTTEQALGIIQGELKALDSGGISDAAFLESQYPVHDEEQFPQVVASLQSGDRGSKEALNLASKEQAKIVDNYRIHRSGEGDRDHHELRREIEDMIDFEEVDPELDEYPDID